MAEVHRLPGKEAVASCCHISCAEVVAGPPDTGVDAAVSLSAPLSTKHGISLKEGKKKGMWYPTLEILNTRSDEYLQCHVV